MLQQPLQKDPHKMGYAEPTLTIRTPKTSADMNIGAYLLAKSILGILVT